MRSRIRVAILTAVDLTGYCDPPFWPKWKYEDDPRLRWMLK